MQRTINAQAAEIKQLIKERDRLKLNVKEATANVYQLQKDLAYVKEKILEKNNEIASLKKRCQ
jgi:galactose-1-phosphate uridylyltransferase